MDRTETRPRLSDLAQEELLYRIRSGELAVGTKLPSEPELAQQMGISRGILREALNSLQTRGYITRTPRGGSHITRPGPYELSEKFTLAMMNASLLELVTLREAIETYAAHLAVAFATEDDFEYLRKLAAFDAEHAVIGCRDFNYHLVDLSGVHPFAQYIDFYYERALMLIDPKLLSKKPRTVEKDLARILKALEKRNHRSVASAMRHYFSNIRKHFNITPSDKNPPSGEKPAKEQPAEE